jgi:photosystem II stability/assembly factor-like uncharacterized protein
MPGTLGLLVLVGGAAVVSRAPGVHGQSVEASPSYGTVVVFSDEDSWLSSTVTVTCDGRDVAKLAKSKYFQLRLPPGPHVIDARGDGYAVGEERNTLSQEADGVLRGPAARLDVRAGAEYYLNIRSRAGQGSLYVEGTATAMRQTYVSSGKRFLQTETKSVRLGLGVIDGVKYYCGRCEAIDSKWIVDREVVVNAALPVITSVEGGVSNRAPQGSRRPGAAPAGDGPAASLGLEGWQISAVAPSPTDPLALYVCAETSHIFKSSDGGLSWRTAETGLPRGLWRPSMTVDPVNPHTVYLTASVYGVYKSVNGADTWTPVNGGLKSSRSGKFTFYSDVQAVVVDPTNPRTVFASTPGDGVYRSADGGGSWRSVSTGLPTGLGPNRQTTLAIDPTSPQTMYLGMSGGIGVFKTTNGGETWSAANVGLPRSFGAIGTIAIDPASPQTVYVGVGNDVFKSTNGAGSWSATNLGIPLGNPPVVIVESVHPQSVYAGTVKGLYKSTSGGTTWTRLDMGLPEGAISTLVADTMNPQVLYVGVAEHGIFRVAGARRE